MLDLLISAGELSSFLMYGDGEAPDDAGRAAYRDASVEEIIADSMAIST